MNASHKFWGFKHKITNPPYLRVIKTAFKKGMPEYTPSRLNKKQGPVSIVSPMIKAIVEDKENMARGTLSNGNYFAAVRSATNPDIISVAVYTNDGHVQANAINVVDLTTIPYTVVKVADDEDVFHSDGKVVWMALLPLLAKDSEFWEAEKVFRELPATDIEAINKMVCLLSDNVYRQLCNNMVPMNGDDGLTDAYPEITEFSQIDDFVGDKRIADFVNKTLTTTTSKKTKRKTSKTLKKEDFNLGVELSDEQKQYVLTEPDVGYVIPEQELYVLNSITKSRGQATPATNFLLTGPAGTGKTAMARHISYELGLPYYTVVCSEGTTEDTLLGCIYPELIDEEEASKDELANMPEPIEILADPVSCYERLTGDRDETVTAEDVLSYMVVRLKDLSKSGGDGIRYRYQETPLVKAFKYGGVCELQDIGAIASATVLTVLNDILNTKDGVVNTPVETIKRHENCFIIATTNSENDIGYSHLNQAVRDRFRVLDVELPPKKVMKERAKSKTGYENDKALDVMVDVIDVIASTIKTQNINGVCGMRALIDWIIDVMNGNPFEMAMNICVLNRVTTQIEEQQLIRDAIEAHTQIRLYC